MDTASDGDVCCVFMSVDNWLRLISDGPRACGDYTVNIEVADVDRRAVIPTTKTHLEWTLPVDRHWPMGDIMAPARTRFQAPHSARTYLVVDVFKFL